MFYCHSWGRAAYFSRFSWSLHIAFRALLIIGAVLLIRNFNNKVKYNSLNVLEHEYALGDHSREEFLERKEELLKK
ncbi:MAG: hypothetical protein ACOCRO_11650 [Halanaerobiales bacterium]